MCCGSGDIQMGMGGVSFPYNTPCNTLGIGDPIPAGMHGRPGSGDIFSVMAWGRPFGKPGPYRHFGGRPTRNKPPHPRPNTAKFVTRGTSTPNMAPRPLLVPLSPTSGKKR